MKTLKQLIASSAVLFFIALGLGNQIAGTNREESRNELYEKLDLFATVLTWIQNSYVEQVSSKDLIYGALKGTLTSLDPHSQFLPPSQFNDLQVETDGAFGGLGMEVMLQGDVLVIISAIPETPAAEAGLRTDDQIVRINGEELKSPELPRAVNQLRGEPGSKVELTLFRPSSKEYFTVHLKREMIKMDSVVQAQILPTSTIGYVKITQFQERTAQDLAKAKENLEKQNITGLILDLRNNPGGLMEEAIKVAGLLVGGEQLIVYTRGRISEQNTEKYSQKSLPKLPYPLVVLINRGSASASEIVAGAVQDYKTGLILGEKSFGKASVQSLIPLKDGSAMRLTTAWYFTPKGRQIHSQGIAPDVLVQLGKEDLDSYQVHRQQIREGKIERNAIFMDSQIKSAVNLIAGLRVYLGKEDPVPPVPSTNPA